MSGVHSNTYRLHEMIAETNPAVCHADRVEYSSKALTVVIKKSGMA